jgi:hypothetical protein
MRKHLSIFILGIVLLAVMFTTLGCGESSLPVQSPIWRDDGTGMGFTQFYTNDPSKYNYDFWMWTSTPQTPMHSVETQVKKISGNQYYYYGVLYCYQDNNNFYCLFITIGQEYCVWKRVGGTFHNVFSWRFSSNLDPGYNTLNKIRIDLSTTNPNTFTVFFNDKLEYTFIDSSFTYGDSGFYASSGSASEESFPNTPVDVRFKQLYPAWSASSIKSINSVSTGSNAEKSSIDMILNEKSR